MSLHVLDPGLATRVVDFGRPASRSLGVPVGGAADRASLALGNALAGNPPNAPALEICLKGPVLRAEARVGAAVFGAPFTLASARQALATGTSFTLESGEEIHFGATSQRMRAYLCVRGGLSIPAVLGSYSSFEVVQVGENLACETSSLRRRFYPSSVAEETWGRFSTGHGHRPVENRPHDEGVSFRALPGPQADWFDEPAFYDQEFTVTPALDRMGIRLEGTPLQLPERELVSEPVCPGAVQVTRDGQCILLGIDGQTIGGYPKIAQVIQADLDRLGQLRPGERIRFQKTDLAQAVELFHQRQAFLREWTVCARESLTL